MSESVGPVRDYEEEFISLRGLERHPDKQQTYFRGQLEAIRQGESTWMARNFESEGICFDYYVEGKPVAQLLIGGWDGYAYETFGGGQSAVHETLGEAVNSVEEQFSSQ